MVDEWRNIVDAEVVIESQENANSMDRYVHIFAIDTQLFITIYLLHWRIEVCQDLQRVTEKGKIWDEVRLSS